MKEEMFSGRRVLITGGLGFIGSNLARRLVDIGAHVTLLDSLIPEYGGNLSNISGIEDKVKINVSDVRDEHSMKSLVRDQDYLFNLAGQTSHLDSMQNPFTDLEINANLYNTFDYWSTCRIWFNCWWNVHSSVGKGRFCCRKLGSIACNGLYFSLLNL